MKCPPGGARRAGEDGGCSMELIVTAGAMQEEIDSVRAVTNHSTGALGRLVAEALAEQGGTRVEKIYYLCDTDTQTPSLPCVETVRARGARQTGDALARLLRAHPVAAVVHAMAVSDYTVHAASTAESLAKALAGRFQATAAPPTEQALCIAICESLEGEAALERTGKLPSSMEHLLLYMRQTPKLIGMVKGISPQTLLVGFKLLDSVPLPELLAAARGLMQKNSCDFVLANDLSSIRAGQHTGYLVERTGAYTEARGKEAIAALIARRLLETLGEAGT